MFTANLKYEKTITMVTEVCCNCGVVFGMPSDFQQACKNEGREKSFYCPNGHGQHYSKSKAQIIEEKLQRELRQKENELASLASEKIQIESELKKANVKLKRVHHGVCPCCNRTFSDLQKHFETKHPDKIGLLKPKFTKIKL